MNLTDYYYLKYASNGEYEYLGSKNARSGVNVAPQVYSAPEPTLVKKEKKDEHSWKNN